MEVVGQYAYLQDGTAGVEIRLVLEQVYRAAPVGTFGGGVNEVQREIIALAALGLPRQRRA
jgi:alkylation response protein AidB-like acyl-CoA dehydrogenase